MSRLLPVVLFAGVTGVAAGECRPIEGIEPLLKAGRVLLLGELHGTSESPAFALDVACHAAARKLPVVLGLELSDTEQGPVDRFLATEGTAEDRRRLLSGPIWQRDYQDGRNSRAMVDLIDGIRRLRRGGSTADIVLFDVPDPASGQSRDQAMGNKLAGAAAEAKDSMTIVLTGNRHSRTTRGSVRGSDDQPMGNVLVQRLAPGRVIALDVAHRGGSAWICTPDCGLTRLKGAPGAGRWTIEIDDETRPPGHDGWYHVGEISASEPARSARPSPPLQAPLDEPVAANASAGTAAKPKASGPLTAEETKFQGEWQAYDYASDSRTWKMTFDGRDFRAQGGPDDWYKGYVAISAEHDPGHLDFVIEDCRCSFKGMASEGIFYLDGESIVVAAPRPGSPRPRQFVETSGEMMRLRPLAKE